MPDSLTDNKLLSSAGKAFTDAFPDDLKSLKYWGFCITDWTIDKDGNDKLNKIPINAYKVNGKDVWQISAQSKDLKTLQELGGIPDLQTVVNSINEESIRIRKPESICYRFSLGGQILDKDKKTVLETIPAPKIVILDYDHAIDDAGNFYDETIREEIQQMMDQGYVEKSVSGHGFHAICMMPTDWNQKTVISAGKDPEIFSGDKFVCLTGKVVSRSKELIANKKLLMDIVNRQVKASEEDKQTSTVPDSVLVTNDPMNMSGKKELHKVIKAMEQGDISGYESRSEAALAVCNLIAREVETPKELDATFKKSVFFQKNYPGGEGWNAAKEKATYTNAFKAKKEWEETRSTNGNSYTFSTTTSKQHDFLDDAIEVDELPENPYQMQMLKMDLSVYPADSLVMKYVNYIREKTNTYPEYSYMGIMFIASVLTCSKAVFNTGYTRRKEMCNLWSMILGLSSISRKSTSVVNIEDLLKGLLIVLASNGGERYPDALSSPGSREGFGQELSEHEVRYFIQDEAAGFINRLHSQNMAAMTDDLCCIYDQKGFKIRLSRNRKKEGDQFTYEAKNPFLSMFMATTPDSFKNVATRLDITSGFLMRFLFANPEYEKDNYKSTLTDEQKEGLYEEIFNTLLAILKFFKNQQGETLFDFSNEAKNMVEDWTESNEQKYFKEGGDKKEIKLAYNSRLGIYARKLAILNFIMTPDCYQKEKLQVPVECMKQAIHMCDTYFMPCFLELEDSIGRTKNNMQEKILSFLKEHGGRCSTKELVRHLRVKKAAYYPELEALIENQEIEVIKVKGKKGPESTYYQLQI